MSAEEDRLGVLLRNAFAAWEYGEEATAKRLASQARDLIGRYIGQGRISPAVGRDMAADIAHIP